MKDKENAVQRHSFSSLGRYQILKHIGRGGMADVWLCEDPQLHRMVAVKTLPTHNQEFLQLFKQAVQAAAALRHPHILAIHDYGEQQIGTNETIAYIVMPYITGGSLASQLERSTSIVPEQAILYLTQAAQAIDYAHSKELIHGDIKPGNMLLRNAKWLLLSNVGIAHLLSNQDSNTRTGASAGTPNYMAPEQALGHAEAASDRYSLAVIAYQLLTGALPFSGETPYDILLKHVQQAPPSPRRIKRTLSVETERILLRGLAKSPAERPPSCESFVQELSEAWRNPPPQTADVSEPIASVPWSKRLREHGQTAPLPFSTQPAPATWGIKHSSASTSDEIAVPYPPENRASSTSQTTTAEATSGIEPHTHIDIPATNPPETAIYGIPVQEPAIDEARTTSTSGYSMPSLPPQSDTFYQEVEYAPVSPQPQMGRRSFLAAGGASIVVIAAGGIALYSTLQYQQQVQKTATAPGLRKLTAGTAQLSLTGHTRAVWNVVWDPTGRYLATGGEDHEVMVWDLASHLNRYGKNPVTLSKPLRSWQLANAVGNNAISWSPDGRGLIVTTANGDNNIYFLDVFGPSMKPIDYFDSVHVQNTGRSSYWHCAWSPHHNYFATSIYQNSQVALWEQGRTTSPLKILPYTGLKTKTGTTLNTQELAWSIDGSQLASITNDSSVIIWDINTDKVQRMFRLPEAPALPPTAKGMVNLRGALVWSPISSQTLAVSNINVVSLWHIQQNRQYMQLSTDDRVANTAPPATMKKNANNAWHPAITGISWSPNGRYIVGGYENSPYLYTWDLQATTPRMSRDGSLLSNLIFGNNHGHTDTITDVAWSPNGRYVASASLDTTAIVWNVDDAQ
jgi:serine/threonine protein kinase/WD40 repeat protein